MLLNLRIEHAWSGAARFWRAELERKLRISLICLENGDMLQLKPATKSLADKEAIWVQDKSRPDYRLPQSTLIVQGKAYDMTTINLVF